MSSKLRIGYSFWGFLGDRKIGPDGNELSTPDGNATYSWSIVWEAMKRGHTIVPLQQQRDKIGIETYGSTLFRAFSQKKREDAYAHLSFKGIGNDEQLCWRDGSGELGVFPELDVLLIEWRFPIDGRNTLDAKGTPWYQPDLERQRELIEHYAGTKTKLIYWDLDHKLDEINGWESSYEPDAIFETSVKPKNVMWNRTRVEPPFVIDDLMQHPTLETTKTSPLISYVGSRYERDDVIDEWIKPVAARNPGRIAFHGKWEPKDELAKRWPGVVLHDRIGVSGFREAYSRSACVPLLAKQSYMETGFITPRPWEAVLFGSVPVGLRGHLDVKQYVAYVAETASNLEFVALALSNLTKAERHGERQSVAHKLKFMDASNFVDRIEEVL